MSNIPKIFTDLFKEEGDGFKANDRELLWRVAQGFSDHVTSDNERHKKHEERCDGISKNVNSAHERISKIKSENTWHKGIWRGVTLISTAVLAVVAIVVSVWTATRTH